MSGADLNGSVTAKTWSTYCARAAFVGYALWRSDPADGVQRFFIGRNGLVWPLASIADVEAFLERVGAPA